MFSQFNDWINGKSAASGAEHQKLREISLEYRQEELIAATSNLDPCRRLGSGNYGCVYRGTLRDGHEVAIKVIEVDDEDSSGFADEVLVLSKFRHPNLVTLMGWGTGLDEDGNGRRFLVYELLDGGDVAHRLQKCRVANGMPFTWMDRLWVSLDAACGLSHMHNSTPKAFHRDIKSANILLDRSGTAKMADFGLSGIAKNKNKLNMTCEQISGTPGYACPHYIKTGRVSEQTEVYAYGMVVMEMLLNTMPACMGGNGSIIYPIFQILMPTSPGALERATAAADKRAEWPPALARDIAELSLTCTLHEERRRPMFTEVGKRLRELCQQYCGGQRPMHSGQQTSPTKPQISASPPSPSKGVGVAATNPQLGYGASAPFVAAGASAPTRPQLGMLGGPALVGATNPQLGFGSAPPHAQGMSAPTNPQLGLSAGIAAQGRGVLPTDPKMLRGSGQRSAFAEVLGELFGGGFAPDEAKEAELAEVILECMYSSGIDVASVPLQHKCLVLRAGEQPWAVGRQQQPNFFARLVPDEATRALISRSHVVISLDAQAQRLGMKKLSPNNVQVDGRPIQKDEEVPILNGTQLQFCGRDNVSPILSFNILMRDSSFVRNRSAAEPAAAAQAPCPPSTTRREQPACGLGLPWASSAAEAKPSPVAGIGQPPSWWHSGPTGPYSLLCVSAIGFDVSTMPREARTVPLKMDGTLMLGRSHQCGLFENLLGSEIAQRYLCCVSRSHLEISPARGEPTGSFEVVNLSANPVAIAGPKLGKGEKATLRPGSCIDFIGTHSDGSGQTVVYLKIKLEAHGSREPDRRPDEDSPSRGGYTKPPTELLLEALGGSESKAASGNLLPSIEEVRQAQSGVPFWLALEGSAVRQSFPADLRVLEGSRDGLVVGRAHQPKLHNEAFVKEVREYLSRDHFRIDRDNDGYHSLVALSSNPIWRCRNGQRRELERGDPPLSLLSGDQILLFTGASDCTPDGPENLGILRWKFFDATRSSSPDPLLDNETMRSLRQNSNRGPSRSSPLEGALQYAVKDRFCLPQVFGGWDDEPEPRAQSARSTSRGKSPGRVTFKDEEDYKMPASRRPATGYIRELPPESRESLYGEAFDSNSKLWR
eukprot:TRINITY_DN30861_c0_g2_i1.p1 TRINITY_DN30861_c0_g2~~TRINITY_DN30861_c0_g2_i1.p1  ORF type:complete len:1108 (+),score=185.60 TRINITY_DN30861_c0_g2_i1:29-3352(+)